MALLYFLNAWFMMYNIIIFPVTYPDFFWEEDLKLIFNKFYMKINDFFSIKNNNLGYYHLNTKPCLRYMTALTCHNNIFIEIHHMFYNIFCIVCVYLIKIILSATSPGTVELRRMSFLNSRVSIKPSSGALVIIITYMLYSICRCSVYIEYSK